MKSKILIFFLFLISQNLFSTGIEIPISKSQKVIGTFSGDINKETTFHAVYAKNKKTNQFEIIPIFVNVDGKAIIFNKIAFNREITILSFHLNNDILTLLTKDKKKGLKLNAHIVDIDVKSKTHVIKDIIYKADTKIVKLKNKTILYNKWNTKLIFTQIYNTKDVQTETIEFDRQDKDLNFFVKNPTLVYTNEFVEHGSIRNHVMYYYDNYLYIINKKWNAKNINVFRWDLSDLNNYKTIEIKNKEFKKIKGVNTFLYKNKIITIVSSKDDVIIKMTDFDSKKTDFKISANKELTSCLDSDLVKKFIKRVSKKKYTPTITANLSIENNIVLTMDYVDNERYSYYDWSLHQQMLINDQQMLLRKNDIPRTIGPSVCYGNEMTDTFIKEKNTAMQFVLSPDFKLLKDASKETKFKNIDKEYFFKKYKKEKLKKKLTIAFTRKNHHFIYYVKRDRKIILEVKSL